MRAFTNLGGLAVLVALIAGIIGSSRQSYAQASSDRMPSTDTASSEDPVFRKEARDMGRTLPWAFVPNVSEVLTTSKKPVKERWRFHGSVDRINVEIAWTKTFADAKVPDLFFRLENPTSERRKIEFYIQWRRSGVGTKTDVVGSRVLDPREKFASFAFYVQPPPGADEFRLVRIQVDSAER
jgi:hypothetical protein